MHDTAFAIGSQFLKQYVDVPGALIVELGSCNVNGTIRHSAHEEAIYVGLDAQPGDGVDLVVEPGQPLPLRNDIADAAVTTSALEHDPFFWMTFLELCRITKPGGFIYINAPSNGAFHRYPLDLWRFYPDAGEGLEQWGRHSGHDIRLIESFIARHGDDEWNDFVAVFQKGTGPLPERLLSELFPATNIRGFGSSEIGNHETFPEDMQIIRQLRAKLADQADVIAALEARIAALDGTGDATG